MSDTDRIEALVEPVAEFAYREWRQASRNTRPSWPFASATDRARFIRGAREALGLPERS